MKRRASLRKDQQVGVMGLALLASGLLEAFEAAEGGDHPLEAMGKAIRRTKRRSEILAETEKKLNAEEKRRVRGS